MLLLLLAVLVLSVVAIVVGALAKGLIWLLVVGLLVFVAATAVGVAKRHTLGGGQHRTST